VGGGVVVVARRGRAAQSRQTHEGQEGKHPRPALLCAAVPCSARPCAARRAPSVLCASRHSPKLTGASSRRTVTITWLSRLLLSWSRCCLAACLPALPAPAPASLCPLPLPWRLPPARRHLANFPTMKSSFPPTAAASHRSLLDNITPPPPSRLSAVSLLLPHYTHSAPGPPRNPRIGPPTVPCCRAGRYVS